MKVLIITKDAESRGGVANYFRLFFQKFDDPEIELEWFSVGSRATDYLIRRSRNLQYVVEFLSDLCRFIVTLWKDKEIKLVQVNPSLIPVPLVRDGSILLISYLFSKKTIVFYRGWSDSFAEKLQKSYILKKLFLLIYRRANCVLVLAGEFAEYLERLGITKEKIVVTRTMFDGDLVRAAQIGIKHRPNHLKLLFLSRISREKGAYDIVNALGILKKKEINLDVCFVGHGAKEKILDDLLSLAQTLGIENQIEFKGFVDGVGKYNILKAHDILLLPSYHEGCPNIIFEAMASKCFIICSSVGALGEVVADRINGRIVRPNDPEDLASKIEWADKNKELVRDLASRNRDYAFESFESAKIINQIKEIYRSEIDSFN
jgi:glycosyltransferase involved in cell wall biosynthesis